MALPSPQDIKLIVSDVDGTLLTSEHTLHPKTVSAFTKLRKAHPDLPIVIASGKQYQSCVGIRQSLGLPDHFPAIHLNGALVHEGPNKFLVSGVLEPKTAMHIIAETTAFGTFVFTEDAAILVSSGVGIHKQNWCALGGRYESNTVDKSEEPDRSEFLQRVASGEIIVPKVIICLDISELDNARQLLEKLSVDPCRPFKITRAIPWILETIPPDVHKGRGILKLCDALGISPSQVLAFGDGENDVDMFRVVGYPVAMANAMSAAISASKYVTESNDQGGVGAFIEKIWNFSEDASKL